MKYGPDYGQQRQSLDFSAYLDGLYGYAMALSRNRTEAEDLVQEACLHALRAMDRLRPDSNVKAWLFTIVRNLWLNRVRRARFLLSRLGTGGNNASDPADATQDPHAAYSSKVEQEQVRAALQKLPVEFYEIIVLREYEELSYLEIAAVLNCPPGTVMSRLARARCRLRDLLSGSLRDSRGEPNEARRTDPRRHGPGVGLKAQSSSPDKPRCWEYFAA
jgi:RNA polymerase sigma-70 factor (ECF subfamily)